MPYIIQEYRDTVYDRVDITAGELNYKITKELDAFVCHYGIRYEILNAARGAVEGAASEFVRRVVNPYEDKKCAENGDVYRCLELMPK